VLQCARSAHGISRIEDVAFAVLETSGTISIVARAPQGG